MGVRAEINEMERHPNQYRYEEDRVVDSDSDSQRSSDQEYEAGANNGPPPPPLRSIRQVLQESKPGQNGRNGLRVAAEVIAGPGGKIGMRLMVMNCAPQPMGQWAVQIQKNPFGLAPAASLQLPDLAPNGGQSETTLLLAGGQNLSGAPPTNTLHLDVAIRNSVDIFYFSIPFDFYIVLTPSGPAPPDQFKQTWGRIPMGPTGKVVTLSQMPNRVINPEQCNLRCKQYHVFPVPNTMHGDAGAVNLYYSAKTGDGKEIYAEIKLQKVSQPPQGIQLTCASQVPQLLPPFQAFMSELLQVRWQ